jgi:ribosome-associated toxin RatA of RatAB toxin-antitoxin module
MFHGQLSIDVSVPPDRFLAVLRDYERYPEFQPDVKSIRVVARGEGWTQVAYSIDVKLALIEYTLEHRETGGLRIDWRFIEGTILCNNRGAWVLDPLPDGGTRVTYQIDLSFAPPTPPGLEKALADKGMPRMLANFKARAEKLFGGQPK